LCLCGEEKNKPQLLSMIENEISSKIIGAAIEVHKQLGPGLLESSYEVCLAYELSKLNLNVSTQVALPVVYKDIKLEAGYRIDILVENKVIIEVKAVDKLADIHTAQLLTYLRLRGLRLGMLINFNEVKVIDGIKRILNGY
jgi:GxxExxY protein